MALSIDIPNPLQSLLGSKSYSHPLRIEGLRSAKEHTTVTRDVAKLRVAELRAEYPDIVIKREDLERFHILDVEKLYADPSPKLMYESSHNVRHFASVLVLATFLGNYANKELGKEPGEGVSMDIGALQLAAMTHDRFRTVHDVFSTVFHLKRHGEQAAASLENTVTALGWNAPQATIERAREIDAYHDVDRRLPEGRSTEVGFFNMIDKMELVRLLHGEDLAIVPYRVPGLRNLIHALARARMRRHEGNVGIFGDYRNKFLPIAQALYQLSMENIHLQENNAKGKWQGIDQFEAVMWAAKELRIIETEGGAEAPAPQPAAVSTSLT